MISPTKSAAGYSLVEVMVAMVVLTVAVVPTGLSKGLVRTEVAVINIPPRHFVHMQLTAAPTPEKEWSPSRVEVGSAWSLWASCPEAYSFPEARPTGRQSLRSKPSPALLGYNRMSPK